MTKQPSSALLDPHLREELETTSARVPANRRRRIHEALTASSSIVRTEMTRAVKASPTGGLRPVLTALADTDQHKGFFLALVVRRLRRSWATREG